MCEKCTPIDSRIAHYKGIAARIGDQQTQDGISRLILELEQQKLTLHPKEQG